MPHPMPLTPSWTRWPTHSGRSSRRFSSARLRTIAQSSTALAQQVVERPGTGGRPGRNGFDLVQHVPLRAEAGKPKEVLHLSLDLLAHALAVVFGRLGKLR